MFLEGICNYLTIRQWLIKTVNLSKWKWEESTIPEGLLGCQISTLPHLVYSSCLLKQKTSSRWFRALQYVRATRTAKSLSVRTHHSWRNNAFYSPFFCSAPPSISLFLSLFGRHWGTHNVIETHTAEHYFRFHATGQKERDGGMEGVGMGCGMELYFLLACTHAHLHTALVATLLNR